eukprot:TRINITY_DN64968_c0_g1_i1.p1 TRINITY_DN64968_c0_g1~~TRINITY_DN64968_c0_g1_i1.p1  ORF type:complete len:599 (+),score=132.25 TRINITY_DN64968_c0_g1_i1:78-1799(+)
MAVVLRAALLRTRRAPRSGVPVRAGVLRPSGSSHATLAVARRAATRQLATRAGAEAAATGSGRLLAASLAVAGAGAGAFWAWRYRQQHEQYGLLEEDVELPAVPEPEGNFVHPYDSWPWWQRQWFVMKRSLFLSWVFAPFLCTSTIVLMFPNSQGWREFWLEQMLHCMQRAGAAFQKFGQWLSMRPDMFPPDVIQALSQLRSDAPAHSAEVSRRTLREQLGCEIDELFEEFDDEPVASGSVGQVHRARLRADRALDGPGGVLRDVAVKVRHPGVAESAFMDLSILWKVVDVSQRFIHMTMPFDRGEFDEVIKAQMDFTREAFNLQRFTKNFKGEKSIRFPKVSPQYVTKEVLVETWAEGRVISNILEDFDNITKKCDEMTSTLLQQKRAMQLKLSRILYDMSMKMMVRDNFVHGDLHGGNILYSENNCHVTILDAGIATQLQQSTYAPFGRFLKALCTGHTDTLIEYLERFNEAKVKINMATLRDDIQQIMDKFVSPLREHPDKPINAADMFGEVMFVMQDHGMRLKGDVASTLFTISISEGLIRQLDPTFDVATNAVPYIVNYMASAWASSE